MGRTRSAARSGRGTTIPGRADHQKQHEDDRRVGSSTAEIAMTPSDGAGTIGRGATRAPWRRPMTQLPWQRCRRAERSPGSFAGAGVESAAQRLHRRANRGSAGAGPPGAGSHPGCRAAPPRSPGCRSRASGFQGGGRAPGQAKAPGQLRGAPRCSTMGVIAVSSARPRTPRATGRACRSRPRSATIAQAEGDVGGRGRRRRG